MAGEEKGEEKDGGYGYGGEEKDGRDESKCAEEKDDGRGRRSPQAAHPWLAGTMVQRDIDGMWFSARILSMSDGGAGGEASYDVEYLGEMMERVAVCFRSLAFASSLRLPVPDPNP